MQTRQRLDLTISLLVICILIGSGQQRALGKEVQPASQASMQILFFPSEKPLGKITNLPKGWNSHDGKDDLRGYPVQGRVAIPIGQPLALSISYEGASNLEKLASIPVDSVEYLTLNKVPIDDRSLARLANHFRALRRIDLLRLEITDKGLESLRAIRDLQALDCEFCGVQGPGLASLEKFKTFRDLWLSFGMTNPNQLSSLARLQALRYLNMRGSKLTDVSLKQIGKLQNLEGLDIKANPNVTDRGLKYLARLKHLSYLNVAECTKVTRNGILPLKGLPLKTIDVTEEAGPWKGLTNADLVALQKAFPKTTFKKSSVVGTELYREVLDTLK
jgi:hypothetical protein